MEIEKQLIYHGKHTRPADDLREVRGIVLHWTGNPGAGIDNHRAWFNAIAAGVALLSAIIGVVI